MLLQVPLTAKIVPLEVLLQKSVVPHQQGVLQQRANHVLLAKPTQQALRLLLLVNVLHALLVQLPLVVLLVEPTLATIVVPESSRPIPRKQQLVEIVQRELTSKLHSLEQRREPLLAKTVLPVPR